MTRYTMSFVLSQSVILCLVALIVAPLAPLLLVLYSYDSWRGWQLWRRARRQQPPPLREPTYLVEAVELEQFVAACCQRLQLATPRIALHATSEFFVTCDTQHHWNGTTTTPCLNVSLPMLSFLSLDELEAIIMHELAHLYYGDVTMVRPHTLYESCHEQLRCSDSYTSFRALSFNVPLFWLARDVRRFDRSLVAQEFRADALAVAYQLGGALRRALTKMETVGSAFHEFARQQLTERDIDWRGANLYEAFRRDDAAHSLRTVMDDMSTHPSFAERLARLQDDQVDTSPLATQLLPHLPELEREMTTLFYQSIHS